MRYRALCSIIVRYFQTPVARSRPQLAWFRILPSFSMARCLSYRAENPEQNDFCGVCGAALGSKGSAPSSPLSRPAGDCGLLVGAAA
jgi:hypothetical protein